MDRYEVYRFDHQTFVVFDKIELREICVCSNYDERDYAEERANKIAILFNKEKPHNKTTQEI